MKGIPPTLYKVLRSAILDCSTLEDVHLHALFVNDGRLALWEKHLPGFEGLNRLARAEALIDFLVNRVNWTNENGLVLFLHVLRDETDVGEACYDRLGKLAYQVAVALQQLEETKSSVKKTRQGEKSLLLADVKVMLRQDKDGWFLQAQNVGQRQLKKVTIFLHPGQALWVNKHRLSLGTLPPTAVSTAGPLSISLKQPLDSSMGKVAYQLGIEVVYLPQSGSQPIRLQKLLEILAQ